MTNTQKLINALKKGKSITPNSYCNLTGSHCLSQMIGYIRREYGINTQHIPRRHNGNWFMSYRMVK